MKRNFRQQGFTLVELVVTIIISSILVSAIAVVMMDTQRSWSNSYSKVFGGAVNDAAVAKTAFDHIVRKASHLTHQLNSTDDLTVYYYADWENSTELDRSARIYRSALNPSEMYIEHTRINDNYLTSKVLLSENVADLEFLPIHDGYTMKLALDDGHEQIMVVSTAILHNN